MYSLSNFLYLLVYINFHYDNSIKVQLHHLIFAVSQLNYQQVQPRMDFYSHKIKLHALTSFL